MKSRASANLLFLIPAVIAIVFVIRLVHEPDLWWQLRTGEYILEQGSVPDEDVFSYTYAGVDWLNVKWGFEVIQATVVAAFGPEGLPVPQFFANLLMLLLLVGIIRNIDAKNIRTTTATSAALLLFLVGMSYRMNGRPELVSYSFTAFYLFIFSTVTKGQQKWLFALIPAQLLWANLHEAYGVGIVMMLIYLFSIWATFFTAKLKSDLQRKALVKQTVIIAVAWLSVAIHPAGLQMLWHPYEIFTQLSQNQFTQEIFSAANKAYWHMPAFLSLAMALIALWHLYIQGKEKGRFRFAALLRQVPLFYLLLFIAFFYLSLKSYRNLPFMFMVSMPLVALWLAHNSARIKSTFQIATLSLVGVLLYVGIVSNWFYENFLPEEKYGWGVSTSKNPVGAAHFITENNLTGNAFTDYLSSSYLLWKLQPAFKTFVDLRDLDIFEADDIEIALTCCTNPDRPTGSGQPIWEVVDQRYRFNYVVILNNPEFLPLHRYLLKGKQFKLVYADALTTVFVRNTDECKELIGRHNNLNFQPDLPVEHAFLPILFNPFYRPPVQTEETFKKARKVYMLALGLEAE